MRQHGFTKWRGYKRGSTNPLERFGYFPEFMEVAKKVLEYVKEKKAKKLIQFVTALIPWAWSRFTGYPAAMFGCACSQSLMPLANFDRRWDYDARYCKGDPDDCDKYDPQVMSQLTPAQQEEHIRLHELGYQFGPMELSMTSRKFGSDEIECKFSGVASFKACRCSPGWKAMSSWPTEMNKVFMLPAVSGCKGGPFERSFNLGLEVDNGNCRRIMPYVDGIMRSVWNYGTSLGAYAQYVRRGGALRWTKSLSHAYTRDGWKDMRSHGYGWDMKRPYYYPYTSKGGCKYVWGKELKKMKLPWPRWYTDQVPTNISFLNVTKYHKYFPKRKRMLVAGKNYQAGGKGEILPCRPNPLCKDGVYQSAPRNLTAETEKTDNRPKGHVGKACPACEGFMRGEPRLGRVFAEMPGYPKGDFSAAPEIQYEWLDIHSMPHYKMPGDLPMAPDVMDSSSNPLGDGTGWGRLESGS